MLIIISNRLATTHAARLGSQAGLGLTLMRYVSSFWQIFKSLISDLFLSISNFFISNLILGSFVTGESWS